MHRSRRGWGVILCLISLVLIHYITGALGGRNKILSAYRLAAAFVYVVVFITKGQR